VSQHVAALLAAAAIALLPAPTAAKGGAYPRSAHGKRDTGVMRVPGLARGECGHCHGAPRDALGRKVDEGRGHAQLFSPNDNALCVRCHVAPASSWLGESRYAASAHGSAPGMVWPGPAPRGRAAGDEGKCVNCHDPHGVMDRAGLVPSLLRLRGSALCFGCHSGGPAPDVASAFTKTYRHPLLPDPGAVTSPAAWGLGDAVAVPTEAATCSSCHNPHAAAARTSALGSSEGPGALLGTSRVRVSNGPRGTPPLRSRLKAGDPNTVREFEVCFKCHASGTDRATARVDVAVALNPANASFHPVEARGRNRAIDRRSFATGWGPDRLVSCSDCHSSDDGLARGPHGSSFPHLLVRRYAAETEDRQPYETDLCFGCHAFRTYGDRLGGADAAFSRFSGHASHLAKPSGYSCWACHDAHGSTTLPALLAYRTPGITDYRENLDGTRTCTATCHGPKNPDRFYRPQYPR
jgi:predicted CXXCH cytochrome family protein